MNDAIDLSDRVLRRTLETWVDTEPIVLHRRKMGRVGSLILRLFRISPYAVIRLDPLGSEVWRLLDGRSVGQILDVLEDRYPNESDLAERLGQYLSMLALNRLVRVDQSGAPQTL